MPLTVSITATGTGTETATVSGLASPTNTVRIYATPVVDETPIAATPAAGLLATPWVQVGIRVNSGSVAIEIGDDFEAGEYMIVAVEQQPNTASAQKYTIFADTTAQQILIANAVAIAINNRSWTISGFLAAAALLPRFELATLQTLKIVVIPTTTADAYISRATRERTHTIQIGVSKKLTITPDSRLRPSTAATTAAAGPLLNLVEELLDYFTNRDNAQITASATLLEGQIAALFDAEKLHTDQTFLSVLNLTYRTYR